ncbi:DNA polymerase III subunit epsilon [Idiomarina xiamenensis]|uniref:DNA polymerase III subunit epsilon n=1 Tax=Idiomarina xiamenensis 10-D-4 TaxID=740709 RepID=K2K910_9GAMM|nr:DNA polymerase III subunit epsilon [Idiomarina xiamenensis]EKE84238.1 DNA polymerase III subunit epsilon [Idiomarina xiamenensis 10-D-4]
MRQVVLDTETTGIDPKQGHRIIEIGCVELVNRRLTGNHYHVYINPERVVEQEAIEVHGITNEYLADKPVFAQIADDFLSFIQGAELVIHNAPFDVGFMEHEFQKLNPQFGQVADYCSVLDTLQLARKKHPGQKNNLDALCRRYHVDNSSRELHGALLDAEILADVYLLMTGGQTKLDLASRQQQQGQRGTEISRIKQRPALKVLAATADEEKAHQQRLALVAEAGGKCLWQD